ncbi:MAG: TIGR03936 family radical SAM-associated protein [Selenomonadaceae bacterium]|nr:TIGR03936 family radical SAM-associated protein [Selenomonadaceae bacterium]
MIKYRMGLTKGEELRFISHLDYAEVIRRAILRAKLPVNYSEGFNPHMKMTFLAALALGVTSDAEYMDVELTEELPAQEIAARLKPQLPNGVKLLKVKKVDINRPTRKAQPDMAVYQIDVPLNCDGAVSNKADEALKKFADSAEVIYQRITPKKHQVFDVKQYLPQPIYYEVSGQSLKMSMNIRITPAGSVKAGEILQLLQEDFQLPIDKENALIHRQAVLFKNRPLTDWV